MKNLETYLKNNNHEFDCEEPNIGHFNRFEAKLNKVKSTKKHTLIQGLSYVAVAASIILLFGVWLGSNFQSNEMQLAQVSPEMQETQTYFTTLINNELATIETERNASTEQLVNDALNQLTTLESNYKKLTLALAENPENKRIIYAMISNFQQRIDILQDVLNQIENVKQQKLENHETYV